MEDFEAYSSRSRAGLLLAVSIALVGVGFWFIGALGPVHLINRYGGVMSPETSLVMEWYIGLPAIVFFGLCTTVMTKMLVSARSMLRINAEGILWTRWSAKPIPWDEVVDVSAGEIEKQRFLGLKLRNPSLYPGRGLLGMLANVNRKLTGVDIQISTTGMDCSLDDALAAVSRFRRAPVSKPILFGRRPARPVHF